MGVGGEDGCRDNRMLPGYELLMQMSGERDRHGAEKQQNPARHAILYKNMEIWYTRRLRQTDLHVRNQTIVRTVLLCSSQY